MTPALDWALPALARALGPAVELHWQPRCGSTNTELLDALRAGLAHPRLLVAEQQDAGRGRLGRAWQSWPGHSLTFSVAWPWTGAPLDGLSLAVGVALVQALDPRLRLKWPNDLWWQQRKLGGILIETVGQGGLPRGVVIGVGLNVVPPESDPGQPAAGLQELDPTWTAPRALAAATPALTRLLDCWPAQGWAHWLPQFEAVDGLRGAAVRCGTLEGQAEGVDASGALRLRDAHNRLHTVASGEAQVRLAPPPSEVPC
ncbi:biotin--[acetyl-CoA-carboxylase] ligase [Inhella gelatinilytica]|uniref:biotin--[biotin carboxyl-carrier protein] ligase n=1 Tax=Inhella gelatinilytica TaxID=2795030 RepID=A0A931ITR5_9BURK|nr:biotin--[acetyl-CoA-carboxylase] ligase [Inhella gelatinilytica]MBH9551802.1 biotin--[acetyl-CoA-carboxylase] ligase [Inhella gelatinilytica]